LKRGTLSAIHFLGILKHSEKGEMIEKGEIKALFGQNFSLDIQGEQDKIVSLFIVSPTH
jgi:hypothetical protein